MGADDTVERLLADGIELHACNQLTAAIECWQRVLELVPNEPRALELLQSVQDEATRFDALRTRLQELLVKRQFEAMLQLLNDTHANFPDDEAVANLTRLTKRRIAQDYIAVFGSLAHIPVLPVARQQLALPTNARLLVALIDGAKSVQAIFTASPLSRFDTMCALHELASKAGMQFLAPLPAVGDGDSAPEHVDVVEYILAEPLDDNAANRQTYQGYVFTPVTPTRTPTLHMSFETAFDAATDAYLTGDFENAQALYETCLALRPGDPRTLANLEVLMRRRKRL
jgi:tetratricopeptide (TPR) repeat protein